MKQDTTVNTQDDDADMPINLAELLEKKRQLEQKIAEQEECNVQKEDSDKQINLAELHEKKRQLMEKNYVQSEDSEKPINLTELLEKKRQFESSKNPASPMKFYEALEKKRELQEQYESKEEIHQDFAITGEKNEDNYSLQDTIDKECHKKEYLAKLEKAGKERFSYFFTDLNETRTMIQGDALTLICGKYEFYIIDFQGFAEPAVKSEDSFRDVLCMMYSIFSGEKIPSLKRHFPSLIEWGILEDKDTGEKLGGWYVAKKTE